MDNPKAVAEAKKEKGNSPLVPEPVKWAIRVVLFAFAFISAYRIRLYAIQNYGLVIHEFDPWFNYRATEYLHQHGWKKFFTWFDHESWYPLGRPVGTTIYPGMQITSVTIFHLREALGMPMSLNDVCCYVPAWFGTLATTFLGLLTYECTGNPDAGVTASMLMAIVPAHIMRSVGGGYDNESIALTTMCMTFYFWCLSLRGGDNSSYAGIGVFTGLAYIYMVAAWGGYIFVLNMIGVHAFVLILRGRFTRKLHLAYSLFYVIGTAGAIQVPVVGWTPLKSLEQLGPFGVFGILQLLLLSDIIRRFKDPQGKWDTAEIFRLRATVFAGAAGVGLIIVMFLANQGYFGPLSSRVRGLFVRHTRTGNPLVDSVAEHQPASAGAYFQYLHILCYLYPIGLVMSFFAGPRHKDSKFFIILYGIIAYYFSSKMVRLVILMGPIGSALGGIALSAAVKWAAAQIIRLVLEAASDEAEAETAASASSAAPSSTGRKSSKGKKKKAKKNRKNNEMPKELANIVEPIQEFFKTPAGANVRKGGAVFMLLMLFSQCTNFYTYCHRMAEAMSQPSIMFKATLRDGQQIMVDDYREAYWWLRDNTPEDSRVMAWWDYGYQINGIANRTSIADGNTWNHEHIATLGRCLTSPEKKAHTIVRHLADYVLIWSGGGGDDLAKSPHMARIGNSVFSDICPGDPTCRRFGFDRNGSPTPMMAASLLYRLHSHNQRPGVRVDPELFEEVLTTKYGKVRIFKVLKVSRESKRWVADPKNRLCDAGGWYCPGQYPPALNKLIKKRKNFQQLEDFNAQKDEEHEAYQREYMARMDGRKVGDGGAEEKKKAKQHSNEKRREERSKQKKRKAEEASKQEMYDDDDDYVDDADIENAYSSFEDHDVDDRRYWMNTADTTRMWQLINENDVDQLKTWIEQDPDVVHIRSADGRGPLWWAYEYDRTEIIAALRDAGVNEDAKDGRGLQANDMKR